MKVRVGSPLLKEGHEPRCLVRSPAFPIFGPGTNLCQAVVHEDCARGAHEALIRPAAIEKSYDLPGAEKPACQDLVKTASQAFGKNPTSSICCCNPYAGTLMLTEALQLPLPVKSEQILRMHEDKTYPFDAARKDFGYAPRTFG